jgi:homoserine dehydrogenase
MKRVRIALLGCGTVGSGFVELLARERRRIGTRHGLDLVIERILVRDLAKQRGYVDRRLLTTSAVDAIDRDCDIVVELVGGVNAAGAYIRRAIEQRRDIVTANKALLAACGDELFASAAAAGVSLGFEGSVCGGVPLIAVLQRALAGDSIELVRGIVNGTCNFILSRMEDGVSFNDALRIAQEGGFAEAEASFDVDGWDAAQKMRIVAAVAFGRPVVEEHVSGIRQVTREAVERARLGGNVMRLVASATQTPFGVAIRVEPRELDANDPLANVRDENNAVVIRSRAVGELTLSGKGAGALPTAAAVLADVIAIGSGRSAQRSVHGAQEAIA